MKHGVSKGEVFLVGGAVRDFLLGVDAQDKDYVVVGSTVKDMLADGFIAVGKDFPVFLHPVTKHEYALARTERKSASGYHGFVVDASDSVTLEEDLARRDLTINAIAMKADKTLVDPFNGQQDIALRKLRHTTSAFIEDPVRVLRAARFLARFGNQWHIDPQTVHLFNEMRDNGELNSLVAERVWKETESALNEAHPYLFFETLLGLGVFPELDKLRYSQSISDNQSSHDLFGEMINGLRYASLNNYDESVRLCCVTYHICRSDHQGNTLSVAERELALRQWCDNLRIPNRLKHLVLMNSNLRSQILQVLTLESKELLHIFTKKLNALKVPTNLTCILNTFQSMHQKYDVSENKVNTITEYWYRLFSAVRKIDSKKLVEMAVIEGKTGSSIGQFVLEKQTLEIENTLRKIKSEAL